MSWLVLQAIAKLALATGLCGIFAIWLTRDSKGYQQTMEERLEEALFDIADRDAEIADLRQQLGLRGAA